MRYYHSYDELILNNLKWSADKIDRDPQYFNRLSEFQKPPFLFIGCSDSRLPIDTFTQTEPGELFIHRNIANQISLTDMNFLSVLEYAIEVLQVKHIIVAGHYKCGGIEGAFRNNLRGLKENWCTPIKDIISAHRNELAHLPTEDAQLDRLAELNVIHQVKNIFKISALERLIESGGYYPTIHGWVLDIKHGTIKDLDLPIGKWKNEGVVPANYDPSRNDAPTILSQD